MSIISKPVTLALDLVPQSVKNTLRETLNRGSVNIHYERLVEDLCSDARLPETRITFLDIGVGKGDRPDSTASDLETQLANLHKYVRPLHRTGRLDLVGIEPDSTECERLQTIFPHYEFHPIALWEEAGKETLFITKKSGWSGLLRPNFEYLDSLSVGDDPEIVAEEEIEVARLSDIIADDRVFDLLKIDVQGAELPILRAGDEVVDSCLLIESEVSLHPFYEDITMFEDLSNYLREFGFQPVLIQGYRRFVRNHSFDDHSSRTATRPLDGEMSHSNALFFNYKRAGDLDSENVFIAVVLLLLYGQYSLAGHIVDTNRKSLSTAETQAYNEHLSEFRPPQWDFNVDLGDG